jgi:hypothetical protein
MNVSKSTPTMPADHFLSSEGRDTPLWVRESTGVPSFAVVDGVPVPYDQWQAARAKPEIAPAGASLASGDGSFALALEVSCNA